MTQTQSLELMLRWWLEQRMSQRLMHQMLEPQIAQLMVLRMHQRLPHWMLQTSWVLTGQTQVLCWPLDQIQECWRQMLMGFLHSRSRMQAWTAVPEWTQLRRENQTDLLALEPIEWGFRMLHQAC